MIISCEKCNKKFEISDNLIPKEGRLVECGSCSYTWHYIPSSKIKLVNEIDNFKDQSIKNNFENESIRKKIPKKQKNKIIPNDNNNDSINFENKEPNNKKRVGFLSYLLVIIISFIAIIIVVETFESVLISFIPGIDFYLSSLYESLKDIVLFFKDLIK